MATPTPAQLHADAVAAGNPLRSLMIAALSAPNPDQVLADLYNSTTNAGATTITLNTTDRSSFVSKTMPLVLRLASGQGSDSIALPAATVAKWQGVLTALRTIDPVDLTVLGTPVADKVLTQAESDALTKRIGSRAEAVWGVGTWITPELVAQAR